LDQLRRVHFQVVWDCLGGGGLNRRRPASGLGGRIGLEEGYLYTGSSGGSDEPSRVLGSMPVVLHREIGEAATGRIRRTGTLGLPEDPIQCGFSPFLDSFSAMCITPIWAEGTSGA
jgi:hypothetical protein